VFNVATIHNPDNVVSLRRSKAVGEPPLLLGISVWTAVKNALSYVVPARRDRAAGASRDGRRDPDGAASVVAAHLGGHSAAK
jgi:xanthine dehydrogenase molybdopterin-binding subunit B